MKVFRLNDYEWWSGEDLESCVAAAMAQYEVTREEAADDPIEVTEAQMDSLTIDDSRDGDGSAIVTYRQYLDRLVAGGQKFPCFFAGDEG